MSVQLTIELPESVFSILKVAPEQFVQQMRLVSAVKWYEMEMVSQAKAAELAGVSRQSFMEALGRFGVTPFQVTPEELEEEWSRE